MSSDNVPASKLDKLLDLYLRLPDDKRAELFNDIIALSEEKQSNVQLICQPVLP